MAAIRLTIWNEFVRERQDESVYSLYPGGIHEHLRRMLECDSFSIKTATLHEDGEHGLSSRVLNETDVLLWWGSAAHAAVLDTIADRVAERVKGGMGLIALHASYASKPFLRLIGAPCTLTSLGTYGRAHVWTTIPSHPIAQGIPTHFTLEHEETYSEIFSIPSPDDIVFITGYQDGRVLRSGVTFSCGGGKIFYFHPGHETMPSLYNEHMLRILQNAIRWAAPSGTIL